MATKKVSVEIPEMPAAVETADQELGVRRVLLTDAYGQKYAACGHCNVRLVNVEERVKCTYCWHCGKRVIWK